MFRLILNSDAKSGVYKIQTTTSKFAKVYCEMTSLGECNGGGWTLMMKINGSLVRPHCVIDDFFEKYMCGHTS